MDIQLTQGRVVVIDDADAPLVAGYAWCAQKYRHGFYAVAATVNVNGKKTTVRMNRLIVGAKVGEEFGFVDGDGLNNRRSNIVLRSHAEVQYNQRYVRAASGRMGVYRANSRTRPWQANIRRDGRSIHLGDFETVDAAARAYGVARQAWRVDSLCGE